MTPDESLLQNARDWLLQTYPGLIALYVFGSAASGQRSAQSDMDLAMLDVAPIDRRSSTGARGRWRRR